MAKQIKTVEKKGKRRRASIPENREQQMISLAMDAAEEQLRNGTASSQVITHFLKLGTSLAKLEYENMRLDNDLKEAKIESLRSAERMEEMFGEAISAMVKYRGGDPDED